MNFFEHYVRQLADKIREVDTSLFTKTVELVRQVQQRKAKVIIAGNGGSAAIASHVAVDFTRAAGVRAVNFNEADLLTCLSNDFGYDQWVAKALEYYADTEDLVILISSSGRSANIINGAAKARQMGLGLVTFSGFDQDNPLRSQGDVNFWVESKTYNVVEMTHHAWLAAIVDRLLEK